MFALAERTLFFAEGETMFVMRGVARGVEVVGAVEVDGTLVDVDGGGDKTGDSAHVTGGPMIAVACVAMRLEDVVDSAR